MNTIVELLKAYRDNRLVGESPRRFTLEDGTEVLATMKDFVWACKNHKLVGVSPYKWEITDDGLRFIREYA